MIVIQPNLVHVRKGDLEAIRERWPLLGPVFIPIFCLLLLFVFAYTVEDDDFPFWPGPAAVWLSIAALLTVAWTFGRPNPENRVRGPLLIALLIWVIASSAMIVVSMYFMAGEIDISYRIGYAMFWASLTTALAQFGVVAILGRNLRHTTPGRAIRNAVYVIGVCLSSATIGLFVLSTA